LARIVYASPDLLGKIEKADRSANLDIIRRCDAALDTGGALGRLWNFIERPTASQGSSSGPSPVRMRLVARVAASARAQTQPDAVDAMPDGTRLYALPGGLVR
jgi:hypothetical protein